MVDSEGLRIEAWKLAPSELSYFQNNKYNTVHIPFIPCNRALRDAARQNLARNQEPPHGTSSRTDSLRSCVRSVREFNRTEQNWCPSKAHIALTVLDSHIGPTIRPSSLRGPPSTRRYQCLRARHTHTHTFLNLPEGRNRPRSPIDHDRKKRTLC